MNGKLNRHEDFNMKVASDQEEVDKYLSDFVSMKQQDTSSDKLLQYVDHKNNRLQIYVKIPVANTEDYYYGAESRWIDVVLNTLSSQDSNKTVTIRQLSKALVRRDRSAVTAGPKKMNNHVVNPMNVVAEVAM